MDQDPKPTSGRTVRFKPKPPRKKPAATVPTPQIESSSNDAADDGDADDQESLKSLQRKVDAHLARHQPKRADNKPAPALVTFQAGASSGALMTFGKRKEGTEDGKTEGSPLAGRETSNSVERQRSRAGMSLLPKGTDEVMEDLSEPTTSDDDEKKEGSYREPWAQDYNTNPPITLPWRRPHSGDPEVLDREEFEGGAKYDETTINPAAELGLLEEDDKPKLLLFQVPSLPSVRAPSGSGRTSSSKGKEIVTTTKGKGIAGSNTSSGTCELKDLPDGRIGKMLVYRSGAVKMKIGDVLYDVSPGVQVSCPQDVMAVDTKSRNCVKSGEVEKWAVVTPDIDAILDDV